MIPYRSWLRSLGAVDAVCLALLLLWAAAWSAGVLHRGFDYDEFEHVHVIWLIKSGLRPFYDFFECHPPFVWYPLAGLFRLVGDSYALMFVCRSITAAGHVLFLTSLALNVALSMRRLPDAGGPSLPTFVPWMMAILGTPLLLSYLVEFRIDAWPNAVLLLAIYRYRTHPPHVLRSSVELGLLAGAAICCSPKLIVFVALFVAASLAFEDRPLLRLAGIVSGGAASLALATLILLALRLNPLDVYHMAITYHELLNRNGGFGHGLAEAVWSNKVPLAIIVAGVISWCLVVRERVGSATFELAVLGFLALQLVLVGFPYKQYYAPWFVLGTAFVPYVGRLLVRSKPLYSLALAVAILYAGANAWVSYRQFHVDREAQGMIERFQWLESMVPPRAFVAASMAQVPPLFRRNAHYHISTSFSPSGYDTVRVMQDMNRAPFSERFTEENYLRELEVAKPVMVMIGPGLGQEQLRAVDRYLAPRARLYRRVDHPYATVLIRKASDSSD